MAGLFGFVDPGMSSDAARAIAGSRQGMFSPDLGILGAALKDAGASFSGRGDSDSLQQFAGLLQQQQTRQQLMAGLTSADPAVRQKAYAQATILGIDPKPFQASVAQQATPDLLSAMRPSNQEIVAPGANAALPNGINLNVPAAPTGQMVNTPGQSLADAVGGLAEKYPELAQQYAPDIVKQSIEADKPYDLAPGATRYRGATPIVTAPLKNNPNQPFNADGTPNKAYQAFEFAKARNTAQVRAEFRAPTKGAASGPITLPHPGSLY